MQQPALVIMAAGMGSRYGGLKQIDPIGPSGEKIIDYSAFDALRAGFEKIIFVIKPEIEADFKAAVGDRIAKNAKVDYIFQTIDKLPTGFTPPQGRTKPWGTAHAVLCCQPVIDRPFAVINADDFYGAEAFRLLHGALTTGSDYAMAGFILKNTLTENGYVSRGVCQTDDSGYLSAIEEYTKIISQNGQTVYTTDGETMLPIDPDTVVSMNCWGFQPDFLQSLQAQFETFLQTADLAKDEFYIPFAVDNVIRSGAHKVKVLKTHEKWHGVTYKEDKPQVQRAIRQLVQNGVYPAKLWEKE